MMYVLEDEATDVGVGAVLIGTVVDGSCWPAGPAAAAAASEPGLGGARRGAATVVAEPPKMDGAGSGWPGVED